MRPDEHARGAGIAADRLSPPPYFVLVFTKTPEAPLSEPDRDRTNPS